MNYETREETVSYEDIRDHGEKANRCGYTWPLAQTLVKSFGLEKEQEEWIKRATEWFLKNKESNIAEGLTRYSGKHEKAPVTVGFSWAHVGKDEYTMSSMGHVCNLWVQGDWTPGNGYKVELVKRQRGEL